MSKPEVLVDQTDLGAAPTAAEVAATKARATFGAESAPVQTAWGAEQEANYARNSGVNVGGRIISLGCPSNVNPLHGIPTGPNTMS